LAVIAAGVRAWGVKEFRGEMLQVHGPNAYGRHQTSTRRAQFLQACMAADLAEGTPELLTQGARRLTMLVV
jgi:hypothetical protein